MISALEVVSSLLPALINVRTVVIDLNHTLYNRAWRTSRTSLSHHQPKLPQTHNSDQFLAPISIFPPQDTLWTSKLPDLLAPILSIAPTISKPKSLIPSNEN